MKEKFRITSGTHPVPHSVRASVILVGFNSRIDLERCLPSLLASCKPDIDVVLVDNASTDGTADWAEQSFPTLQVLRSSKNLGFGGGNNLGARDSGGKYLAFLNPDTSVDPGWLEVLVTALENDPEAGLATSKILLMDQPDRINTCGNDVHLSGITLCRGMGQPRQAFSDLEKVNAVSGAAFVIRRDLFEKLGGFDEAFFMYMEDTDLSLRARLAGFHCLFVPASIVYHDYTLTFGPRKTYYQERNRYRMLLKVFRTATLVKLLPALLLAEVITWGFVLLKDRGHLGNKLRAYAWILSHIDELHLLRHQMQRLRVVPDQNILAELHYHLGFEQTGSGLTATLAHLVFDPLFRCIQRVTAPVEAHKLS